MEERCEPCSNSVFGGYAKALENDCLSLFQVNPCLEGLLYAATMGMIRLSIYRSTGIKDAVNSEIAVTTAMRNVIANDSVPSCTNRMPSTFLLQRMTKLLLINVATTLQNNKR